MTEEKHLISLLKNPKTQQKGFRIFLSEYKEKLYWCIRKIVLNHDDADDVLQNTFIKIYKNIHNFREDSKLYSWAYRIATNEALNHLKKNTKAEKLDSIEHQQFLVNKLESDIYFDGNQIQLKLQKAIATLPEKQRIVFNMKYFEDKKYTEISTILNTSIGGLKASYHHAVKKIEQYLNENETIN